MKTNILIFMLFVSIQAIAQSYHYDYVGMPIKSQSPCGKETVFKPNQTELPYISLAIAFKSKQYMPLTNNTAYIPEDFYLFKRKKKASRSYPKTSNIIRF